MCFSEKKMFKKNLSLLERERILYRFQSIFHMFFKRYEKIEIYIRLNRLLHMSKLRCHVSILLSRYPSLFPRASERECAPKCLSELFRGRNKRSNISKLRGETAADAGFGCCRYNVSRINSTTCRLRD